jgi:hypothetical protein
VSHPRRNWACGHCKREQSGGSTGRTWRKGHRPAWREGFSITEGLADNPEGPLACSAAGHRGRVGVPTAGLEHA